MYAKIIIQSFVVVVILLVDAKTSQATLSTVKRREVQVSSCTQCTWVYLTYPLRALNSLREMPLAAESCRERRVGATRRGR